MIVHVEMDDVLADMPHRLNLEDAQTVADVWTRLAALPNVRRSSARPAGLVVLVNGRLAEWRAPLSDGDVVRFVAAPGGG